MNTIIKNITNDQMIKDQIVENTPYNYKDYMCVFENAGYEIPPEYLGMLYTMSENFNERKQICETTTRDAGAEPGLYIKRNDWIDPTKEFVCGIFNLSGVRQMTETGDKRQFPSKNLCDMYNNPKPDPNNVNNIIISKFIPSDIINPVTDYNKNDLYDDNKSYEVRDNFMITIISISIIIYLFYVFKFQINRPYKIYDITQKIFLNRLFVVLLFFAFFIYCFCPYGTCFHLSDSSTFIKSPASDTYNKFCDNLKNFRGKRINEILTLCDNILPFYKNSIYFCNKTLDTINDYRTTYYNFYKEIQGCSGCLVPNPCVKRYGHHKINFIKSGNVYIKQCQLCNRTLCTGDHCYPNKKNIYEDDCQKNIIIEHQLEPFDFKQTSIKMKCKYCNQTCEINNYR